MKGKSRLLAKVKILWANKLEISPDTVDQLSRRGFHPSDCSSSPQELVALCSFLSARKPVDEVVQSISMFAIECTAPAFSDDFFGYLEESLQAIELTGLRSHARDLRKLGRVVAKMQNSREWEQHWAYDTHRKLQSAIKEEPFLPQKG